MEKRDQAKLMPNMDWALASTDLLVHLHNLTELLVHLLKLTDMEASCSTQHCHSKSDVNMSSNHLSTSANHVSCL